MANPAQSKEEMRAAQLRRLGTPEKSRSESLSAADFTSLVQLSYVGGGSMDADLQRWYG